MSDALGKMMTEMEQWMKDNRIGAEIEYPIEVASIESRRAASRKDQEVGSWVSIRPVGDEKTYLGVYLGDLTLDFLHNYNLKSKVLSIIPHGNPAIYVPDLKRVVWGCESWWGTVNSPEDLRKISDADIQNIWYVKALKELESKGIE